nr:oxygen-insensitive NAD(P)H nitroreductase [Qipengyuania qiaonensis]
MPLVKNSEAIIATAESRYSTKVYDAERRLSADEVAAVKTLLRLSPSSVNSQPWHFILASSDEGKARIAKASEKYPFNTQKIHDASHVILFASRTSFEGDYVDHLLDVDEAAGRYAADPQKLRAQQKGGVNMFVDLQRQNGNLQAWMDAQTYLNLGQLLLGAAAMGIDATPMEGVDTAVLDEEFGLAEKGFRSLAVVCLGYRADDDYNAKLPKSRLPEGEIITEI